MSPRHLKWVCMVESPKKERMQEASWLVIEAPWESRGGPKGYPPTHPGAVTKVSGGWCVWLARESPELDRNGSWMEHKNEAVKKRNCPWAPEKPDIHQHAP